MLSKDNEILIEDEYDGDDKVKYNSNNSTKEFNYS